jgi:death-on-curing protein
VNTIYLDVEDLMEIAEGAIDHEVVVLDHGLLAAAAARPRASAFGEEAYPDLHSKAAALLQSLDQAQALEDGNKRLAWAACRVFLGMNEVWFHGTEDEAVELGRAVSRKDLNGIDEIATALRVYFR